MAAVNPPAAQQQRSRRTRQALLDAGLRLLSEQGPQALTIAAVSAEADVSGATVYRRFGDKDGLLAAIQAEFTGEFRAEFAARLDAAHVPVDAPATLAVEVAVRGLADTFRAQERLLRVFAVLGLRDDDVLAEGGRASRAGGLHFRDLLWPHRTGFRGVDAESAIDMAYRLVYAACLHRILHGADFESARPLTWDALTEELVRVTTRYLCGAPPGGA